MPPQNTVHLDDALKSRVDECARVMGLTPDTIVQEALEEYLAAHGRNGGQATPKPRRGLAEVADSIAWSVPNQEWAKLPTDLAKNFEHHRYGYPRED